MQSIDSRYSSPLEFLFSPEFSASVGTNSPVVIDVGIGNGVEIDSMLTKFKNPKIIGIEANEKLYRGLVAKYRKGINSGNVNIARALISDSISPTQPFYVSRNDILSGSTHQIIGRVATKINVPPIRLDSVSIIPNSIDVLWINTNFSELSVIRSLGAKIQNVKYVVCSSTSDAKNTIYTSPDIFIDIENQLKPTHKLIGMWKSSHNLNLCWGIFVSNSMQSLDFSTAHTLPIFRDVGTGKTSKLTSKQLAKIVNAVDVDGKIGVGIVTYSRKDFFDKLHASVVSNFPNLYIAYTGNGYGRIYSCKSHKFFDTPQSVAVGKNWLISEMMKDSCEHIFILEDDIEILDCDVFKAYISCAKESGLLHLMYGYHGPANMQKSAPAPREVFNAGGTRIAFNRHCCGALEYFHRSVIEYVGGYDEGFYNSWEHVEHSYRAVLAGFIPAFWWWPDMKSSHRYIKDLDPDLSKTSIVRNSAVTAESNQRFKRMYSMLPTQLPDTPKIKIQEFISDLQSSMSMRIPDVSFILAARNDSYGANCIEEVHKKIRMTCSSIRANFSNAEIILVDWCSDCKAKLQDVLGIPDVKHIYVDTDAAALLMQDHPDSKMDFYEYVAKDIGSRYCTSENLIFTNIDILFTPDFDVVSNQFKALSHSAIIATRHDVPYLIDQDIETTVKTAMARSLKVIRSSITASGDFLAISAENYLKIGGYLKVHANWDCDNEIVRRIRANGLTVTQNYVVYHLDHPISSQQNSRPRPKTAVDAKLISANIMTTILDQHVHIG